MLKISSKLIFFKINLDKFYFIVYSSKQSYNNFKKLSNIYYRNVLITITNR